MGASTEEKVISSVQHLEFAFAEAFHKIIKEKEKKIAIIKGNGQLEDIFIADFAAKKLANKEGFFSKSDPFMDVSRMNEDGQMTHVYRSAHIQNTLDPHWGVQRIPMYSLCNGDLDRPLKIFHSMTGGARIGSCLLTEETRSRSTDTIAMPSSKPSWVSTLPQGSTTSEWP